MYDIELIILKLFFSIAASVLRMFHHSFGKKVFERALHKYLVSRQFKTAKPYHLYAAIQAELKNIGPNLPGDLDIEQVNTAITSWTNQAGYPVITATRNGRKLKLSQVRYRKRLFY